MKISTKNTTCDRSTNPTSNCGSRKSEAKQMIDTWDSMKPGPEKNRFWDKLVPYLNAYPELWKSGPRLRTEKGEKDG